MLILLFLLCQVVSTSGQIQVLPDFLEYVYIYTDILELWTLSVHFPPSGFPMKHVFLLISPIQFLFDLTLYWFLSLPLSRQWSEVIKTTFWSQCVFPGEKFPQMETYILFGKLYFYFIFNLCSHENYLKIDTFNKKKYFY